MATSSGRAGDAGSASTGQRVVSASLAIASPLTPPRPPARITPRTASRGTEPEPSGGSAMVGCAGRAGGNGPGRPTSGSRNGRLRWIGPVAARSNARRASERQVWARSASATPGSWNQRTERPNRCVWSIVWGAPTSRSSGGRSAVTTSSGTSEAPASTTAGMEVDRRRAARRQQDRRHPGDTETEGDEGGGPLVVHDVDRQFGSVGDGQGHRRAS